MSSVGCSEPKVQPLCSNCSFDVAAGHLQGERQSAVCFCRNMGSSSSDMKTVPNSQELMEETGFSAAHLFRLYERFEFLDKDNKGHLRPEDFEAVQELSTNPIRDRIIGSFFPPGQETADFPTFVRILAHFRPTEKSRTRGDQPEPANSSTGKLKFAFQLYDQDRDGKISKDELLQVLRAMLEMQVTEEQLQSMAERAIQEADLDKDKAISFEEFRKTLEKVDTDQKMSSRFMK
ncbi:calcineurin B homologous protein 2 [Austrofundulus limnaeus]|uniref:Calcineurin B homologous protein 2 n=1 Tax=Austrofundulus limnaeus TaxID=52670 RepID=A0A2I4BSB0_AUSLI|nr:PREDICTED: calcineurin B homologous protein 2-like [Austrofundulus limnaeus]